MHNATALNHAYIDTGIFCIHASAHPSHLEDLTKVITKEFVAMSNHLEEEEFKVFDTLLFFNSFIFSIYLYTSIQIFILKCGITHKHLGIHLGVLADTKVVECFLKPASLIPLLLHRKRWCLRPIYLRERC